MDLRDQDSAEEYCELNLQQVRQIMNVTHRFKRFLNNSAQRDGFRGNKLFCQNDHRCDTPPPKDKLLQVFSERSVNRCSFIGAYMPIQPYNWVG